MTEAKTVKRIVCRHGADNSIELVTVRTDTGYAVKATQAVCKRCLDEIGVNLADNNRAVVMEMEMGLRALLAPHNR